MLKRAPANVRDCLDASVVTITEVQALCSVPS